MVFAERGHFPTPLLLLAAQNMDFESGTYREELDVPGSGERRQGKNGDQFLLPERLLQHRPVAVLVPNIATAVAGREEEWHRPRGESVGTR